MFPLTYAYNVEVHSTKKLFSFILSTTRLPHGSIAIARPMPPDVSEIDPRHAYRLRLIHRAFLLRKIAITNSKIQARYKMDYNKDVRFEPLFAAGDFAFVERPPLTASAADRLAFERYSKLLPRRTEPFRAISVRPEYVRIDQNGIRNTVSINRQTRVAKEGRSNVDAMSVSRPSTDRNPVNNTTNEEEKKNSYTVEKIAGHQNRPMYTYYTVRWNGYGSQDDTTEPAEHISRHFR